MTSQSRPLNSWDIVKIIGLLLMFLDHAGAYFLTQEQWLRAIGRGSAPIFLFLAGYAASYRFSRELLVLAALMTLSNFLMGIYTHALNILVTILLSRGILMWWEKRRRRIEKPLEWFIVSVVFLPLTLVLFQYGTFGLLFAVSGYMKARQQYYMQRTRLLFLVSTFVLYALTFTIIFDLGLPALAVMLLTLAAVFALLWRMDIHPVNTTRWPSGAVGFLKLCSRYSAYIYAFHLIVISWISGYGI